MFNIVKFGAVSAAAVTALVAGTASAQIAQESFSFGVEVELANDPASITGLENMSMKFSQLEGLTVAEQSTKQSFCLFSPTRYFNMSVTGTAKGPTADTFYVENPAAAGTSAEYLGYVVAMYDIFNGGQDPLGTGSGAFTNGVPVYGIDSMPFNNDKDCTDGENIQIVLAVPVESVSGPGGGAALAQANYDALVQIKDGQLHSYTDTLTIVVEPAL